MRDLSLRARRARKPKLIPLNRSKELRLEGTSELFSKKQKTASGKIVGHAHLYNHEDCGEKESEGNKQVAREHRLAPQRVRLTR